MFVDLNQGANFINVFRTNFSYESLFVSFSLHSYIRLFVFWHQIFTKNALVKHWWNWRQERKISVARPHPKYVKGLSAYDVAILKVDQPFQITPYVQIVGLATHKRKGSFAFNFFQNTVKLVYNDHPRDPKIVAVMDRWSLFGGHLC